MSRTVATVWHASLSTLAAISYFLFVLPRWWELTGFTTHALGTVFRVIVGVLVGLAALPVLAALKRARKPEYGTPQLALTLLTGSIGAHILAGTLIAGTAISEIWLSLDNFGMWQFAIYGAAAAIGLLGVGAYYLSFVAEMPPPPPKPIKPKAEKQPKQRPWSRKKQKAAAESGDDESEAGEAESDDDESDDDESEADEAESDDDTDDGDTDESESTDTADDADAAEPEADEGDEAPEPTSPAETDKLRPSGKRRAKSGE